MAGYVGHKTSVFLYQGLKFRIQARRDTAIPKAFYESML
jgi:hypothetical protein